MKTKLENKKRTRMTILSDREIVMSRTFDAPRALLFKIYTDPKHIPQFWGPSKALFQNIGDRDGMLNNGMETGAVESWDRLAGLLENEKQTIIN